jgi:hypothetical protein
MAAGKLQSLFGDDWEDTRDAFLSAPGALGNILQSDVRTEGCPQQRDRRIEDATARGLGCGGAGPHRIGPLHIHVNLD